MCRFSGYGLIATVIVVQLAAQPAPVYRLEREPIAGGAELITLFGRQGSGNDSSLDVPLLSVLRDTLGDRDPENDRLRFVWILTNTRPNPFQRVASALPFACFRVGGKEHSKGVPAPIMDLGHPSKNVWSHLLNDSIQVLQLDPMGAWVRSTTRAYRGNSEDYLKLQTFQALHALNGLLRESPGQTIVPEAEIRQIYSRLSLNNRALGGLVRQKSLARFYDKQTSQLHERRAHNWELLRQRAELCGLYFEPLAAPDDTPQVALLWIARSDLEKRKGHWFSKQFLNISNPWTDDRLLNWTGYTQVRYFDAENRTVAPETPEASRVEMIPLAFYSLDYPRVPLLLADFRDGFKAKRRELIAHGASTIVTGVFGWTRFGNWPFWAASTAWTFVRTRHGVPLDRTARLQALSESRELLAANSSLDQPLKNELLARLDHLALNPLENSQATETTIAWEQYRALLRYARAPEGLAAKLDRDRQRELVSYTRSNGMRLLSPVGRFLIHGAAESPDEESNLRAQLDLYRRAAYRTRLLHDASSPRQNVDWDPGKTRHAFKKRGGGAVFGVFAGLDSLRAFAAQADGSSDRVRQPARVRPAR